MKRLSGLLIVILLVTFGVGVVSAQDNPDQVCLQRNGFWDSEQERCILRASFSMETAVPLNYDQYTNVSNILRQFVDSNRAQFLGEAVLYGAFSQPGSGAWTLNISYEEYSFSPAIVSVVFSLYHYTGGANGYGTTRAFVFDLANDQQLAVSDLFLPGSGYLDALAPLVRDSLSTQYGIPVDDQWLVDGTAPTAANYQNVALTADELLVYFDEYQVGPGALGPVTARIPLAQLSGILAPAYLP